MRITRHHRWAMLGVGVLVALSGAAPALAARAATERPPRVPVSFLR